MNKQITQQNLEELMRLTLINILNAKGVIYTYYKQQNERKQNVLVNLFLPQEECYVLIIKVVSRGIIRPGSTKGYTRMIISIYKTKLIY